MNTPQFKIWLIKNGASSKVASDIVSRLKRLDFALISSHLKSSVDFEFNNDCCEQLLKAFSKNGKNEIMKKYQLTSLPIGFGTIHTYKLSLTKYILFKNFFPNS